MFSHSEDSPKYSECNIKMGDCKDHIDNAYDNGTPKWSWYNSIIPNQCTKVLVENTIKPSRTDNWFRMVFHNLVEADLSYLDTTNCSVMHNMFMDADSLTTITYGSKFVNNTPNGTGASGMFINCPANRPSWYTALN